MTRAAISSSHMLEGELKFYLREENSGTRAVFARLDINRSLRCCTKKFLLDTDQRLPSYTRQSALRIISTRLTTYHIWKEWACLFSVITGISTKRLSSCTHIRRLTGAGKAITAFKQEITVANKRGPIGLRSRSRTLSHNLSPCGHYRNYVEADLRCSAVEYA